MTTQTCELEGPDYANDVIRQLAAGNPNLSARRATAEYIARGGRHARYTDEGRAVFAAYLDAGCPRTWEA